MSRLEDWPRRLDAAIEAARERPFCWGSNDCVTFAAGVVQCLTGRDPAIAWRGRYRGKHGALRLIAKNGGLQAMVTATLGEPVPTLTAQRGDVVLRADDTHGPALGICLGTRCAFVSPSGLVFRPIQECSLAWRV